MDKSTSFTSVRAGVPASKLDMQSTSPAPPHQGNKDKGSQDKLTGWTSLINKLQVQEKTLLSKEGVAIDEDI